MNTIIEEEEEEESEPFHPNLLNMPKVVMEEVLKNLDCRSIFRLQKVCRDLRFSIDKVEPELHLESLSFKLPLATSYLSSYDKNGSKVSMQEAETLMKNPKLVLKKLSIDLQFWIRDLTENIEKKKEDLKKFCESIKSILKNKEHLLKTKEISLQVNCPSVAPDLVKYLDLKTLKSISIEARTWYIREAIEMNFSELETLEQWKNADELKIIGDFTLAPIESFASFKSIFVRINEITIEKLNAVKELFIRSPKMKNFIIECHAIRRMKEEILLNFGRFDSYKEKLEPVGIVSYTRETWTWIKDDPRSSEDIKIVLTIHIDKSIEFSKI